MIDRETLTRDLARRVSTLEDDLRVRVEQVPEVGAVVRREWQAAHDAGRTAHDEPVWAESLLTQVAVAWVLATVFVRFSEDNGLLPDPVLSGPGERLRRAEEAQRAWFRTQPPDRGDRDYIEDVFHQMAALPGIGHVFEAHNPVWQFGPSEDAVRDLLWYWREVDPETGDLRRDFTDPAWDTRFLGDLYQDLSEHAKKQYALLQTPEFVEEFILDRTLDPAIDEFGLDGFKMIDVACGSGHFLLGSFGRLLARWRDRAPQDGDRASAERALQSIYGIDLNPFAAAIARFRLLVAAQQASGIPTLAEAPAFTLNIAVGDSLLHGPAPGQQVFELIEQADPASRHLFATEDGEVVGKMLEGGYHAVVANPPYITPKDPAANAAYRRRYSTCHRQYALSVPFMERLFDLAVRAAPGRKAGYVGQITSNSFMKREFGKPLIEQFLAKEVDLTHVIDTSGAYIPGHGTPTVILLGRNQAPVGDTVRAVLGIRGEPAKPDDPANGEVWSAITAQVDHPGSESEFVSAADFERTRLGRHPWSLQGGGADSLTAVVERSASVRLVQSVEAISTIAITREDDAYFAPVGAWARSGVAADHVIASITGDVVRDWRSTPATDALFPYSEDLDPVLDQPLERLLWPVMQHLLRRKELGGFQTEVGKTWYEWNRFLKHRFLEPLGIPFAFVATHNHFLLDRGGSAFNRSAPVIKMRAEATEQDHLAILGPLNSAVGCFWMKQVFHGKGNGGVNEGYRGDEWEEFYEFDGTKLKQFPLPAGSALAWSERLDALAQELSANLPAAVAGREVPTRQALDAAHTRAQAIRLEMVAVQEELDWRCLFLYGVTDRDLSSEPGEVPAIERGSRAFEIVLARMVASGEVSTTWFVRHGSMPVTTVPAEWPGPYRERVEERIALIASDRNVGLVERPEYKRRWNWDAWKDLEQEALRVWLLDRLENPSYWPDAQPRSVAQLADTARLDAEMLSVAEVYLGTIEVDLVALITNLVRDESVPYVAACRYTEAGLRTRAAWERTWELQRAEGRGDTVGAIPVPPKYGKTDFREPPSWKLRGKLDVPKERFVSYPGLERDADPTLVVGWAGWDHLEQAQALAGLYGQRQAGDGWEAERLLPIIAGMAELVPWLMQWHNEPDVDGTRMGDFFTTFVASEAATNRFSEADLASWRPPAQARGRRKASGA